MVSTLKIRLEDAIAKIPGKTQAGLARACGIKPPSVNGWFSGDTKELTGKNLVLASEYLGVRPKWLALGLGPMLESEASIVQVVSQEGPYSLDSMTPGVVLDCLESILETVNIDTRSEVGELLGIFAKSLRPTTKQDILAALDDSENHKYRKKA